MDDADFIAGSNDIDEDTIKNLIVIKENRRVLFWYKFTVVVDLLFIIGCIVGISFNLWFATVLFLLLAANVITILVIIFYSEGYHTKVYPYREKFLEPVQFHWKMQATKKAAEELLRFEEKAKKERLSSQEAFHATLDETIGLYQKDAKFWKYCNTLSQLAIIILSILVASLTSGLGKTAQLSWVNSSWLTPILSIMISILTGIMGYFKFRDRGYNAQLTADAIEAEKKDFDLGINDYEGKKEEMRSTFTKRIQYLITEQNKRQLQLEQNSDAGETKSL